MVEELSEELARWFETENQYRYQIREPAPKGYVCGQKQIQAGIYYLVCRKGDEPSQTYSIRFDKRQGWTKERAKEWIKEHKDKLQVTVKDIEDILPKRIAEIEKPDYFIYLVPPHGRKIWDGSKKLIVKTVKFTAHLNVPIFVIDDRLLYAIIQISDPQELDLEDFKRLRSEHRISEEERHKWSKKYKKWETGPFYGYQVTTLHKYPKPIPVRIRKGIQIWGKSSDIVFTTAVQASDMDLLALHSFLHAFPSPSICPLHWEVQQEIQARGMEHIYSNWLDRNREWFIKDWRNYKAPNISDDVLRDDHRITHTWIKWIKENKRCFQTAQWKGMEWKEQLNVIKRLHDSIAKEFEERGWEHNTPVSLVDVDISKIEYKDLEKIDDVFIKELATEDLEPLHDRIHELYREIGRVTEPLYNADVFVMTAMYKKGVIDEDYENKDALDEAVRFRWQEYPPPTLEMEEEPKEITLEKVLETFKKAGTIPVKGQPYGTYLAGRVVNQGKLLDGAKPGEDGYDLDLILRQTPDPRVIVAFKKMRPKWLADRVHVVFDPTGPIMGYNIPVHGYALNPLPRELMTKGFGPLRGVEEEMSTYRQLADAVVGKPFIGLKPKSGFGKHEFFEPQESWEVYGADNIKAGIITQEKVDGRRFHSHLDKAKKMFKMITEDRQRNRGDQFPEIEAELMNLKGVRNAIFDGELLVFEIPANVVGKNARTKREIGELVPREDTAVLSTDNENEYVNSLEQLTVKVPNRLTVGKVPEEIRKRTVFVLYDILYLNDEPLNDKTSEERLAILQKVIPRTAKYVDVVRGETANTMKEYFRLVAKYRSVHGSEGVVMKRVDSKYPIKYSGENRTDEWAKLKNLKEIDVMVWEPVQKKTRAGKPLPTWMYISVFEIPKSEIKNWYPEDIVEWKGKVFAKIGRSYGSSVRAKRGDIITVMPIRIREYSKNGKRRVTWMFPYFKEKRTDKTEPDTWTTVQRIIKIGTGPSPVGKSLREMSLEEFEEFLDYAIKPILIKLRVCPYHHVPVLCPFLPTFGGHPRLKEKMAKVVKVERLQFPINCVLAYYYRCYYAKDYYYDFSDVTLEQKIEEYIDERGEAKEQV